MIKKKEGNLQQEIRFTLFSMQDKAFLKSYFDFWSFLWSAQIMIWLYMIHMDIPRSLEEGEHLVKNLKHSFLIWHFYSGFTLEQIYLDTCLCLNIEKYLNYEFQKFLVRKWKTPNEDMVNWYPARVVGNVMIKNGLPKSL